MRSSRKRSLVILRFTQKNIIGQTSSSPHVLLKLSADTMTKNGWNPIQTFRSNVKSATSHAFVNVCAAFGVDCPLAQWWRYNIESFLLAYINSNNFHKYLNEHKLTCHLVRLLMDDGDFLKRFTSGLGQRPKQFILLNVNRWGFRLWARHCLNWGSYPAELCTNRKNTLMSHPAQ